MTVPNASLSVTPSMLAAGGFGSSVGQAIAPEYAGTPTSTVFNGTVLGNGGSFFIQVDIPWTRTITGVGYFVGSATDATVLTSGLFTAAGVLLAKRTTGQAQPGTSRQHLVAFDTPYVAQAGTYFMGLGGGTSTTGTYYAVTCALAPYFTNGTFGAMPGTITPPSGFTVPGTSVPLIWLY